jgi:hypothetical protein
MCCWGLLFLASQCFSGLRFGGYVGSRSRCSWPSPYWRPFYVVAILFIETDYRDADGFMDCWPWCSALQEAVWLVFWLGGGLLVLSGLFSLGALLVLAVRRRRGNPARY